jgi:hypothetical protein
MTVHRDRSQLGQLATLAAVAALEGVYLLALFARNASAFRQVRVHWVRDLARESGIAGVVWLTLIAGLVALIVTLLVRNRPIALLLVLGILVGCVGLETSALVERRKFSRMIESMTNLRQTGLKILEESRLSTSGLPVDPSPELAADGAFRDGWRHPLRYLRMSPNHAILVAAGSDGRIEAIDRPIKRQVFPPSGFDHDIIGEIVEREFSFTVYPDGPAQGIPCAIYSAFGCFSYWR